MATDVRKPLVERSASWGEVHATLKRAQKSNRNAPAYSRWINRPLGRVLAATAFRLGLTPDTISLVSAAFTYSALVILASATPSILAGVSIALLLVLGYALDAADGQVARLRGGGSLAGEWLDHVLDAVKVAGFHVAVTILWFRHLGEWPEWTLLIPLVFTVQASVWFFTLILTDLLLRNVGAKKQTLAVEEGRQPMWTSLMGIPADYGFLCLTLVLLGWFDEWRLIYALLAAMNVLLLMLQLGRWYLRVRRAG